MNRLWVSTPKESAMTMTERSPSVVTTVRVSRVPPLCQDTSPMSGTSVRC